MAYIGKDPINIGTGLFSQDTFTGDGSTTTFDLSNVIPDGGGNDIQVFVDNVRQQEGSSNAYTIGNDGSGDLKRITFTAAPASSAAIYVLNPGTRNAQQISTVSDNAVTTAKVQDNAVTVAKLASTLNLASNTITLPATVAGLGTGISNAQIAADAVDATKIADDAISEEHLDPTAITGNTELSATASSDDVLLVFDTSASTLKKIQVTNINSSPTITSISPTNVSDGDGTGNHTFIITGTNYLTGVSANLINNSGTTVAFDSVTRNSATQITGVIAKSSLLNSGEPFDVEVRNSNGQSAKLLNQINLNAKPVFTTASGSLGTGNEGASFSTVSVNATDPESAGNVTFELQSGALPSGITFTNTAAEGGSAVFSGTYPQVSATTTFNFVLRAVDAASNTSSRAFSITSTHVPVRSSFTSSGTFAVPAGVTAIDALVVAGGGGSGNGNAGGSGAGGLIFMPGYPVSGPGTLTVTVGDGGTGSPGQDSVIGAPGDPGKHPSADVLTAKGGGHGDTGSGNSGGSGGAGGTGGCTSGGTATQPTQPGDSGAYGFGNNGGTGNPFSAGGGGGAGASGVGGHGNANGGDGKAYTIADGTTSVYYAGGGGGYRTPGASPAGGQGGGGGAPGGNGQQGSANKGGGSGGGDPSNETGGKGIVIIAY